MGVSTGGRAGRAVGFSVGDRVDVGVGVGVCIDGGVGVDVGVGARDGVGSGRAAGFTATATSGGVLGLGPGTLAAPPSGG